MHFPIIYFTAFVLLFSVQLKHVDGKDDISFNYVFDYLSNIEIKTGEKDFLLFLKYVGTVEASPYILNDGQELVLMKLNINQCDELKIVKSVVGIVIRRKGLPERMIVDDRIDAELLNLFKGVVNVISIDEMRENKTETDVNGECFVSYESVTDEVLVRQKSDCNKTTFQSPIAEIVDSFSIYQDSKVTIHYRFNTNGALIAVDSFETHLLESVLSEELSQTFRSNTSLLLKNVNKAVSLISSATVDSVIANIFGKNHRDVIHISVPNVKYNEPMTDTKVLVKYRQTIKGYSVEKRAEITLKLMTLLRQVTNRTLLVNLISDKQSVEVLQVLHDALIGCSTKLCSEIIVRELDRSLLDNVPEANRMLIMMQHTSRPSEYMIRSLWTRVINMTEEVYDQAIQTVASMVERLQSVEHMATMVQTVVGYIEKKLAICEYDHCFQVHLSAARNTKLPQFRRSLELLLVNNGRHSQTVMASVFSSICSLNYDEKTKIEVRELLLNIVRREINFYRDPHLKSEAILCLVQLESETDIVVSVLNLLTQDSDVHLQVFLAKKFRELIKMGIIRDGVKIMDSAFFSRQLYHALTYKDESKMLVNQLMSTRGLYSDIHFNVIGDNGGVIRNSMTDIFLVTTAHENHLFSLATHLTGLQSLAGTSSSGNADETVEGLLKLILFGKEARPIKLFSGTSDLMSAIWYAPSSLQSLLSATFFPIDLQRDISFQNGMVLSLRYVGSTNVDFSFRLSSNLWYKTADSLLKVDGQVFVSMESRIKSLSGYHNLTQSFSLRSGLDFETNIDFSATPMKNCLSVSRPLSKIQLSTESRKSKRRTHATSLTEIQGSCYSLSRITDSLCSRF